MRLYKAKIILIVSILTICNIQPTYAITNAVPAAEGLAVKVYSSANNCTGAIWLNYIVITAAHCVVLPSGVVANSIGVSAFVSGQWIKSEVAGVKLPKNYTGGKLDIYGQSFDYDIAFLILKNKLWDYSLFPNLRIANATDWETYKTSQTSLEEFGYGFTTESSSETPTKAPVSAMFYLDVALSSGPKDWAVMHSNTSSSCRGDSGGPVIYYRQAENALVLVGILSNSTGPGQCGSFQFGSSTSVFTKLSSYADLAASTLNTASKYQTTAKVLNTAYENLDGYKTNNSDLSDFADQLPLSTKKRVFDNNKNVAALYILTEDYENKINDYQEILDQSMDFTFINSGILEANSPAVGSNFEVSLNPFETKINALLKKIAKVLPSAVCTNDLQTKDLPSSKKCPKGYTKKELTKPF